MSKKKIPELFKRIPGKILFEQAREDFNATHQAPLVTTTEMWQMHCFVPQASGWGKAFCI
jgi:hypothetical protein